MSMTKEKEIPLNKEDFKIMLFRGRPTIIYKEQVPMWITIDVNLEEYNFYISVYEDKIEEEKEITIVCKDGWGDVYTYGLFDEVEECTDWLEEPYPLY